MFVLATLALLAHAQTAHTDKDLSVLESSGMRPKVLKLGARAKGKLGNESNLEDFFIWIIIVWFAFVLTIHLVMYKGDVHERASPTSNMITSQEGLVDHVMFSE